MIFDNWVRYSTKVTSKVNVDIQTIYQGHHHITYKGVKCLKCPFDYVIYQMLLWEIKPDVVIEIGTLDGGGTLYLADLMDTMKHGRIDSIDIADMSDAQIKDHKRINLFYEGWEKYQIPELRKDSKVIVIDDGAHTYEQVRDALQKFYSVVSDGSYYIVEDGIIDELGQSKKYHGGPNRAIEEFLATHPEFKIDKKWNNMFGDNATFNTNGYLKKVT